MIQKTEAEKAEIKAAKQAWKKNQQPRMPIDLGKIEKLPEPVYILTGIMEDEEILDDNYPVHWDYLYVLDENGGKVIRSDIQGKIKHLKADLRERGYKAENIRRCNMAARNFF